MTKILGAMLVAGVLAIVLGLVGYGLKYGWDGVIVFVLCGLLAICFAIIKSLWPEVRDEHRLKNERRRA